MKNKLFMAVLSVVIAFGLWLYVVTVVSPESEDTYANIPVVLRNESLLEERGLMVTEIKTPTVTLRLKGNRTDLANLNSTNITVAADVSSILEADEHALSIHVSFPGDVADNSIEVLRRNPSKITLVVEEKISKTVPVTVEYSGTLPDGFIADGEAILDYGSVIIAGPSSVIGQITQAKIEVNLNDRNESINQPFVYTLCDENGAPVDAELVTTNAEAVNVELKIQRTKEITLDVTVLDGGGATRDDLSITIEPAKIWVSGSDKLLEQLGDTVSIGQIDLSKPLSAAGLVTEFTIGLPEGITIESTSTAATVTIQFKEMSEKTLNVSNVRINNIPAGLQAELITQALDITVRGPKTVVDALSEDDITLIVDATNVQIDSPTSVEAVVSISNNSDIVAVGSYQIKLTLRQPNPEGAS